MFWLNASVIVTLMINSIQSKCLQSFPIPKLVSEISLSHLHRSYLRNNHFCCAVANFWPHSQVLDNFFFERLWTRLAYFVCLSSSSLAGPYTVGRAAEQPPLPPVRVWSLCAALQWLPVLLLPPASNMDIFIAQPLCNTDTVARIIEVTEDILQKA